MKPLRDAILALLLLAPGLACAQPPAAPAPPSPPHAPSAPPDTTRFLPPWLSGWIEIGGGWMAGPSYLKRHYESGQAFAAGIEARPGSRWAIRSAVDYQMLIAHNRLGIISGYIDPLNNTVTYLDTMYFETQTTGWMGTVRAEAGARLPADCWLTAGAGGGYMHSGLDDYPALGSQGSSSPYQGAVASGWGWLWTIAMRYDFTPSPRAPLGLDVRTSELRRGADAVRTWAVRLCYRMPAGP